MRAFPANEVDVMSLTRHLKGKTLSFVDRIMPVKPLERTPEEQLLLDRESRRMHLYFCPECPSSISIKRYCERFGLHVVQKDVQRVNAYRNELVNGGGESRVPCLRVDGTEGESWVYSPDEILEFINNRFSVLEAPAERTML
ncbi:glutaredoxin family protein [Thalassolituus sp.]|uniref:glutaredoxin family protein n=1 Tax=Thalassolituus sp. TaxID=2030822 RepID=UPI003514D3DC